MFDDIKELIVRETTQEEDDIQKELNKNEVAYWYEDEPREKVRPVAEFIPTRVLELTMEFSDKGYELVEARKRAWHKYTWDNCEMINTAEKPKVLAIHGN